MKQVEIEKIIVKYINQEANHKELEELSGWLKKNENISIFNHFVNVEYLTAHNMGNYNINKAKAAIDVKLKANKRKQRRYQIKRFSVAASILILFGFVTLKYLNFNTANQPKELSKKNNPKNKAILTLGDGREINLEKDKNYSSKNVVGNSKKLLYTQDNKTKTNLSYNYLTIPRGGNLFVQLADGSKVWLNSESKLKYPDKFIKGKPRQIELIYGEAYLEVSPSTKHNGDVFKVISKSQEITVLGTHFNIKAYIEDKKIETTLVEGNVNVKKGNSEVLLKPNQQSITITNSNSIKVLEVDASQEIAWIKGVFSFNEESLENMMKTLARWYDVEFIFETPKSKKYLFTGVLEKTNSITDFLEFIKATSENEISFELKEKTVIIK